MSWVVGAAALAAIGFILADGVESIVLPRRVNRRFRPARFFYTYTWLPWSALGRRLRAGRRREAFLSVFGPVSMLVLLAAWALGLVASFAALHFAAGSTIQTPEGRVDALGLLYMSGVTFFTLGYGDVIPRDTLGRVIAVIEAGVGFGFLALVIGYLPVLYTAFSRRETEISLFDARGGSPPSAAELLTRMSAARSQDRLDAFLERWERWAAELLESHLSFPVLSYYRSQHDNQSWLAALTAILDTCAVVLAAGRELPVYQARLTFAMARHAVVDLSLVFLRRLPTPLPDRLPPGEFARLGVQLDGSGFRGEWSPEVAARLAELRGMYEPFVAGLANHFLFALPPFVPAKTVIDNWQTSAFMRRLPGFTQLAPLDPDDDHFE